MPKYAKTQRSLQSPTLSLLLPPKLSLLGADVIPKSQCVATLKLNSTTPRIACHQSEQLLQSMLLTRANLRQCCKSLALTKTLNKRSKNPGIGLAEPLLVVKIERLPHRPWFCQELVMTTSTWPRAKTQPQLRLTLPLLLSRLVKSKSSAGKPH